MSSNRMFLVKNDQGQYLSYYSFMKSRKKYDKYNLFGQFRWFAEESPEYQTGNYGVYIAENRKTIFSKDLTDELRLNAEDFFIVKELFERESIIISHFAHGTRTPSECKYFVRMKPIIVHDFWKGLNDHKIEYAYPAKDEIQMTFLTEEEMIATKLKLVSANIYQIKVLENGKVTDY